MNHKQCIKIFNKQNSRNNCMMWFEAKRRVRLLILQQIPVCQTVVIFMLFHLSSGKILDTHIIAEEGMTVSSAVLWHQVLPHIQLYLCLLCCQEEDIPSQPLLKRSVCLTWVTPLPCRCRRSAVDMWSILIKTNQWEVRGLRLIWLRKCL